MVFGFGKAKPVKETEAEGEIERVYHEIKQSMRVSGINLNFRTWAGFDKFFPMMWDRMHTIVETRQFEDAADKVRTRSVDLAETLGKIDAKNRIKIGESQKYQIAKVLELYHYINPKLLILTAKVKQALEGEARQTDQPEQNTELIERGVPARMYPMEMVAEEPDDGRLAEIYEDIKDTLSLSSINSDYRTLALWRDYLEAAWNELKPIVHTKEYENASSALRETARELASSLPAISLSKSEIEDLGEDYAEILKTTEKFEQLLPSLIINITLFSLDWQGVGELKKSPFPAESRRKNQGGERR